MTRTEELIDQIHLVNEYVDTLPVDIDMLEQLVELFRLQHDALQSFMFEFGDKANNATVAKARSAIAAFNRFEQGGE